MKPQELTNEMIKQIGVNYLTRYPEGTRGHHHQELAKKLLQSKGKNFVERWNFLFEIYESLEFPSGKLVSDIDALFMDAFDCQEIEKEVILPRGVVARCTGKMVADHLRKIFNAFPIELDDKESVEAKNTHFSLPKNFFFEMDTTYTADYHQIGDEEPSASASMLNVRN